MNGQGMNIEAVGEIEIGNHIQGHFAGMTFNLDTLWSSVFAAVVVIGLGLWMRWKITSGVPSGIQLTWEAAVSTVENQVEQSMGLRTAPFVVPLAVALFFFILISNWIEIIPTCDKLISPTADTNLTYALAIIVIVWMHIVSVRRNGPRKYVGHYFKPYPILAPFTFLEELVKPLTLALRLFGNMFSGGIMIALIGLFPFWLSWAPTSLWKLFDMAIGLIQAFIFALLTILYFSFQLQAEEGH
jgi:F-type H+-transporting ATPase subunit a